MGIGRMDGLMVALIEGGVDGCMDVGRIYAWTVDRRTRMDGGRIKMADS